MPRLHALASLVLALPFVLVAGPSAGAVAPPPQPGTVLPWPGRHAIAPANRRQAFAATIAARLGNGVTAAQVVAAFDAARAAHPTTPEAWLAAVSSRLGVAPQALRAAIASAHAGMHPGMHMRHRLLETAASYLGMSPQAMVSQLRQGRSLADLAGQAHKPVAGLEAAIVEALRPEVHRMVSTPWPVRQPGPPQAAPV